MKNNNCTHTITRKLYFQRGGKWVTTDYSICDECGELISIKKEVMK